MMHQVGWRYQRTIEQPVVVEGIGYITGNWSRVRFRPARPNSGVLFQRIDLRDAPIIPARIEHVTGANRRTIIGNAPAQVELIEHVMAALSGLKIDNCIVELTAAEPPGLDGSALCFVEALTEEGGIVLQREKKPIYSVKEPITVTDGRATLTWHPSEEAGLTVSYILDYGYHSPIGCHRHTQRITPDRFLNELAMCRTFLTSSEATTLQQLGIGSNTTAADLLVYGEHGPIGGNSVRFANEPARHKALDILGDFALFPGDLQGHVVGFKSGHALNAVMVRRLVQDLAKPQTSQNHSVRPLLRVA
jgi:UDP-3-O-[3-hydroxymyristoyl] N-acetylglucosamine deacetylase